MGVRESIGTKLYVSATLPTTLDNNAGTGYPSLTPTLVGEVTEIPEFGGQAATVEHTPLATGVVVKFHGAINSGSMSIPLALNRGDAGQTILKAAFASRAQIAFIVEYPDGTKDCFLGKVMSEVKRAASVGNVVSGNVMVEIDTPFVELAAAAPANLVLPAISGTVQQGQTLTAWEGIWTGSPVFTYQWQEDDSGWANISGATGKTYVPVAGNVGNPLRVIVTGTNSVGAVGATSAATVAVAGP
jgi:hypothetical protein